MQYLFILIIGLALEVGAQSGWFHVNPRPPGNTFLAMHFMNADSGIVVGESGSLLKTISGGEDWTTPIGIPGKSLHAVHFPTPQTGYAVGGSGVVIKSEDGGKTWLGRTSGTGDSLFSVHFTDPDYGCVVGTGGAIYITEDGGSQWTRRPAGTGHALRAVHFPNMDVGFAAGDAGTILKTEDGGTTWGFSISGTTATLRSVHFLNADTGIIVGDGGTVLFTRDGGSSWFSQAGGTIRDLHSVQFLEDSSHIAVGAGGIIIRTTAANQRILPSSGTTETLRSVRFADSLIGYAVGEGLTLLKTTDAGLTWAPLIGIGNRMTPYWNYLRFTSPDLGFAFARGSLVSPAMLARSTDGGSTWNPMGEDRNFSAIDFADSDTGFAIGMGDSLFKSEDGGADWDFLGPAPFTRPSAIHFLDGRNGFVMNSDTIFRSQDGGSTWTPVFANLASMHYPGGNGVFGLKDFVFPSRDTGFALGLGEVRCGGTCISRRATVLRTTDSGNSWDEVSTPNVAEAIYFTDSQTGFGVGQELNSTSGAGIIMKTEDGGESWFMVHAVRDTALNSISFQGPDTGLAVGNHGIILKTVDGGRTWLPQTSGTTESLETVTFGFGSVAYAAGTGGVILQTLDGGGPVSVRSAPARANPLAVGRNSVQYTLRRKGKVRILLYDARGKLVHKVRDQIMGAGLHTVDFAELPVTRGAYILDVRTEEYRKSLRIRH